MADGSGMKCQGDMAAIVKRSAAETGRLCEAALLFHGTIYGDQWVLVESEAMKPSWIWMRLSAKAATASL